MFALAAVPLVLIGAVASACSATTDHRFATAAPNQPAYVVVVPMVARDGGPNSYLLSGSVVAGPTCPVERVPPDPRCAPRPVAGAVILVVDSEGNQIALATSDAQGGFELWLDTGTYTLIPQPVPGLLGTAPEQTITISRPTSVLFTYDTGIR